MCRTEQVLLLSDDLTSTLINTSFNFGLKIKAFSRGQMLVSSNSFAMNVSYYEFISLFSKLECRGGGHNISGFCGQFILFFIVLLCCDL